MSEQNKQLVSRAIEEIWNGANFAAVDNYVASDIVIHATTPENEIHGPEGIRQFYTMLHQAFPDIHFTIEDQMADGDRVVTRWRANGTHTGVFNGIPPTGVRGVITGIDIDRIANGEIVECWASFDELGLLQQLGVMPIPEQAAH